MRTFHLDISFDVHGLTFTQKSGRIYELYRILGNEISSVPDSADQYGPILNPIMDGETVKVEISLADGEHFSQIFFIVGRIENLGFDVYNDPSQYEGLTD